MLFKKYTYKYTYRVTVTSAKVNTFDVFVCVLNAS